MHLQVLDSSVPINFKQLDTLFAGPERHHE